MPSSLLNSVTQILSSNLLERFSSVVGLPKTQLESAMQAGVPAVLAALSSVVLKPGGAEALKDAVDEQPAGALAKITDAIGGSSHNTLIDSGVGALRSLLGSVTTSAISSAIGQYAGIGGAQSNSVMGLLGSTVMAALGKQQRANNLDAAGLANLLTSQKNNIVQALPPGIAKYLQGTGILDNILPSDDERPGSSYSGTPRYTAAPTPKPTPMQWGWLLPALVVLALGSLAWRMLSHPDTSQTVTAAAPSPAKTETTTSGSNSVTQGAPSSSGTSTGASGVGPVPSPSSGNIQPANFPVLRNLRGIKVGDVDFGAQTTSAIDGLRGSLASISDEASARSALASLKSSDDEFGSVSGLVSQLSPENRKSLASAISTVRPALDQLFDKALLVPGASAVIKPTIDNIRAKLDTLTTT
jgi:Bacterial protein of unknown function (DUF937)